MTQREDLLRRIRLGEDSTLELKQDFASRVARHHAAPE